MKHSKAGNKRRAVLPRGWIELFDHERLCPYYYQIHDRFASFTRPTVSSSPASSDNDFDDDDDDDSVVLITNHKSESKTSQFEPSRTDLVRQRDQLSKFDYSSRLASMVKNKRTTNIPKNTAYSENQRTSRQHNNSLSSKFDNKTNTIQGKGLIHPQKILNLEKGGDSTPPTSESVSLTTLPTDSSQRTRIIDKDGKYLLTTKFIGSVPVPNFQMKTHGIKPPTEVEIICDHVISKEDNFKHKFIPEKKKDSSEKSKNLDQFTAPKATVEHKDKKISGDNRSEISWTNVMKGDMIKEDEVEPSWTKMWKSYHNLKHSLNGTCNGIKGDLWISCLLNPDIKSWVDEQRKSRGKLNKTQLHKLYQIGFVWDASILYGTNKSSESNLLLGCNTKENHDVEWERGFSQLINYIQVRGDAQVEDSYRTLGRWARQQRAAFFSSLLEKRKLNLLCNVGFNFERPTWNDMYTELVLYKRDQKHNLKTMLQDSEEIDQEIQTGALSEQEGWQRDKVRLDTWILEQQAEYHLDLINKSSATKSSNSNEMKTNTTVKTTKEQHDLELEYEKVEKNFTVSKLTSTQILLLDDLKFVWGNVPRTWIRPYYDFSRDNSDSRIENTQRYQYQIFNENLQLGKSYSHKELLMYIEQKNFLENINFQWDTTSVVSNVKNLPEKDVREKKRKRILSCFHDHN